MPFKGGPEEAAKMIMGLGPAAGKAVLEDIRVKNPEMAAMIEKNMVTMDDLRYLTTAMLIGLLRDIDLEVFGLAMRTIDQEVAQKILAEVSTGIRLDIEDGFKGPPKKVSEVEEAQAKVLEVLRSKIALGHIVINPEGDELV
jgi:flagellar motor switch protein FliG